MTQGNGVKHTVTPDAVHNILLNLIMTAAGSAIQKGFEREDWIVERLQSVVENNDQLIPGLKDYVDLPWVDQLQAQGVSGLYRFAIRKAYSFALAKGMLPAKTPTPPAPEPTEDDKKVADALGVDESALKAFDLPKTESKPAAPPVPDQSAAKASENDAEESEDDDGDEPDYAALVAEYAGAGGWYAFPGEDGGAEHKVQGKEAAIEYLKTRDDLVYDEDASES